MHEVGPIDGFRVSAGLAHGLIPQAARTRIMTTEPVLIRSDVPVSLIAGGPVRRTDLAAALRVGPRLVAADGGADRALALGAMPCAVIGDMDSVGEAARAAIDPALFHRVEEQDSTDFDKALRHIEAPLVLAVGCLGGRVDHALAVLNALVRSPARCLLIGARDVAFHGAAGVGLALRPGDRLSLFPLAPVAGRSRGLEWPIDGLAMAPGGRIGTSNRVTGKGRVTLAFDAPGMVVIVPRARLGAVVSALAPPPARGG